MAYPQGMQQPSLIWTTTDRFSAEHGVKIGVYSDSGVGKTRLFSTALSLNPVIASAENGLLSLRRWSLKAAIIRNLRDLKEFYAWCVGSNEAKQYYLIGIDSVSEVAEVVLKDAIEAGQSKDKRQAYGQMQEIVTGIMKDFRDISGKHVCMTFKMESIKDDYANITKYGPMFPGKNLGPQTPYLLDEFFALRLHQNVDPTTGLNFRYIQTQPDLQYHAKDRSGSLAPIEPPDLSHIINKIMGAK